MVFRALLTAFILFFLVAGYVGIQGYREYRKAVIARAKGDVATAVTHYQRAIKWYLPGAFYVANSAAGLWQVGMEAEGQGKRDMALMAYQELRSAFYSARSFYTPGRGWIEKSNQKIAALMAEWEASVAQPGKAPSLEDLKEKHLAILMTKERPDYFWSVMLEIGFFGWVGATVGFIFQVFQGEKGFNSRRALQWGSLFLICYFLWIVGMLKA